MSSVRRVMFTVALSAVIVSVFFVGTFFETEAGDVRRGKAKSVSLQKSAATGIVEPRINEIDADTPSTDVAEFVEISAAPGASLDGFVLVFYTGSDDTSYAAIDLDGLVTDSNGLVLLGNSGVAGVDRIFANGLLQNGQDAVAIYAGNDTDFPNGTAVTTAGLVDALVYDTADADDPGLLALLNPGFAQVQLDEASGTGGSTANGVQRCLPGARDGRSFTVRPPSPDVPNLTCQDTAVDLNGDRRTDFLVARPQAAGFDSASLNSYLRTSKRERSKAIAEGRFAVLQQGQSFPLVWYGLNNNAPGVTALQWGDFTTDELLTADFDGDGRDDITVWRPGSVIGEQAYFYSINSSDSTARIEPFGQIFDDPAAVGDYDGDGIDDPAVYRCPDQSVGTCYFYYRGTLNNPDRNITFIPFGIGQGFELLPVAGDFNGDGKHDFAIQGAANSNPANGVFHILINGTFQYTAFQWGLFNDAFFAGDFDGDGTSDIVVTRFVNGALIWYVKESDGGVQVFQWGQEGDFEVPGDYDADGRTDFAIYRENATDASFWVRPSGGGSPYALSWGQPGDYPVAFSVVQPF